MAPQSMEVATKHTSVSPYQLDDSQTAKASSALLTHIQRSAQGKQQSADKKSLLGVDPSDPATAEPIWLVLSTKKHIVPQSRLKPGKILLPHSLNVSPNLSICLITPDPQRAFKDQLAHPSFPPNLAKRITRVIDVKKLQKKYQSFESRRQLRDSHEVFLADDRILGFLSKALGKVFYQSATKRPIPVHLAAYKPMTDKKDAALPSTKPKKMGDEPKSIAAPEAVAKEIERTLFTTQVQLAPSQTTAVRVGLSSHTPEQLADNVRALVGGMAEKYVPRRWKGIQAIHIKGPNTTALPIWLADTLWEDEEKVIEDEEAERLRLKDIENKKNKKRKIMGSKDQLAIENGKTDVDSVDQGRVTKKRKQRVQEEDFGKEMKERREKLREQKRKILSSLEKDGK